MGSATSDDDPTRRVPGPGGRDQGGPGPGGPGRPLAPPPWQGHGYPPPDDPTTRLPPADPQRGQTAQFASAGGWPQGPGGAYPQGGPYPPQGPPGAYASGGPPPGGGRGNRGLVIALAVALLVLAGIAVALAVALTRDEGETAGAGPSTPGDPVPTSASSAGPTGSTSAAPSRAPSSPAGTAGDRTDDLLAAVPADFSDCAATGLAGDGDVAAVECGPSTTQPGPQTASFHLYEDTATLDQVFASDAAGLDPLPAGQDCATAQGVTTWNVDGVEGGQIACTITDDGLLVVWTDREFGIEGLVAAPGTTQEELSALAGWWRSHSDYRR